MRYREYSWLMAGVMACVSASAPACAQVITTVAGTVFFFPATTLPGGNAPLGAVSGIAVDRNGNVYAADPSNNIVMQISPTSSLSVFSGNGIIGVPAMEVPLQVPLSSTPEVLPWMERERCGNPATIDAGSPVVRMEP
jgi:hypothetical protein